MRMFVAATTALAFVSASSAFAAEMPLKAPAPAAPLVTWTGFYIGGVMGGAWSSDGVSYSGNDPIAIGLINGTLGAPGEQPLATSNINRSGPVGGLEIGYNWQAGSNFVLGVEADISAAHVSGTASATSFIQPPLTQATASSQNTEWYGTVRGRLGWLATPNLLLFGTGGLAYGRTAVSANVNFPNAFVSVNNGVNSFNCFPPVQAGTPCLAGASTQERTGWTAGGGAEYRLDAHWTAKLEYQFVDLGTEAFRLTAVAFFPGTTPASLTAAFRDRMNVVRLGLNYHF